MTGPRPGQDSEGFFLVSLDLELEESLLDELEESLPEELVLDEPLSPPAEAPSPLDEPPPSDEPEEPSPAAEPFRPPLLP